MQFSCRPKFVLVACVPLFLLLACDGGDSQALLPSTAEPSLSLQTLLEELTQQDGQFDAPTAPQFPADLLPHPSMRAESFTLRTILYPGSKKNEVDTDMAAVALQGSIQRVAVRSQDAAATSATQWAFNSVMRVSLVTDALFPDYGLDNLTQANSGNANTNEASAMVALAQTPARQTVQRAALGLAGTGDNKFWVGSDELVIAVDSEVQDECSAHYQWSSDLSATRRVELRFNFDICPQSQSIPQLATWQMNAIAIEGNIMTKLPGAPVTDVPVHGTAWIDYSWGDPPTGVGAVVFDRLTLSLDTGDVLNVSRSKRLSGSGPVTVTSTLQSAGVAPRKIVIDWQDEELQQTPSGHAYPRTIQLQSDDASLAGSVTLRNSLPESTGAGGTPASAAVTFDGDVSGAGFLDYTPVPVSRQ